MTNYFLLLQNIKQAINLLFKTFVCLLLICVLPARAQNLKLTWGPSTEKTLIREFNSALKTAELSEADTKNCVKCMLGEFKRLYPKGINMGEQQWFRSINNAGNVCTAKLNDLTLTSWTIPNEVALKAKIFKMFPVKMETEVRTQFTDCITEELKTRYPSGYTATGIDKPRMDSVFYQLTKLCSEKIDYKGYLRWTKETDKQFQEQVATYFPEEMRTEDKSKYIACITDKLKAKYPEGISFTHAMQIEFRRVVKVLIDECASGL